MVELALIVPPHPSERWDLARQMDVTKAVIHPLELGDGTTDWSFEELLQVRNWLESGGLEFAVLEGSVPLTDRIRLGLEGRDEDVERFKEFLRDCGRAGVPVVCYDWMAGVRWARTGASVPARGGSLVTEFDRAKLDRGAGDDDSDDSSDGDGQAVDPDDLTHERLWEALEHFLREVGPVAEAAGVKLGLHPDDPPRESVHGYPRIVNSVDAYDRVLAAYDSEYNGVTFCQGNFAAMGVDVPEAIRHFGDRINFVHFRDVRGDAERFTETWHDDGPTDMLAAMRAYEDVGFDGPMRPDHVPTMAGEDNSNPGYHSNGRLFAIGYMKGLLEAARDSDPE